jgi:hypothetical protein
MEVDCQLHAPVILPRKRLMLCTFDRGMCGPYIRSGPGLEWRGTSLMTAAVQPVVRCCSQELHRSGCCPLQWEEGPADECYIGPRVQMNTYTASFGIEWLAVVNTPMNFRVPWKVDIISTSWTAVSMSRSILLHIIIACEFFTKPKRTPHVEFRLVHPLPVSIRGLTSTESRGGIPICSHIDV